MAGAVLMNDTSGRGHFGCDRVMANLTAGLEREGLTILGRSPVRDDWEKNRPFLAALARADIVVINGEGTLHHGRPAGARLLRVAGHPLCRGKPVVLVNTIWEANPPDWIAPLRDFALVAARDSASAARLRASGIAARWLPDLSLAGGFAEGPAQPRRGIVVGDSVRHDARRALARLAQGLERGPEAVRVVPTRTPRARLAQAALLRGALYRLYFGVLSRRIPRFDLARDGEAYLAILRGAALHVTGRFHGACLSLLTRTPVLCLASNTSKIETLLADAGLDRDRLIGAGPLDPGQALRPYTPAEAAALESYVAQAVRESRALFAEIAALAGAGARRTDMP